MTKVGRIHHQQVCGVRHVKGSVLGQEEMIEEVNSGLHKSQKPTGDCKHGNTPDFLLLCI